LASKAIEFGEKNEGYY